MPDTDKAAAAPRDKNHWIKDPAERERLYAVARQDLLNMVKQRGRVDLSPVLVPKMVRRMIDNDPTVGIANKERLIHYMGYGPSSGIYRGTAGLINQKPDAKADVASLNGDYVYYRYDTPLSYEQKKLVPGTIRIFTEKTTKDPTFHHWSHNWPVDADPEHTGFVFRAETEIFFLGRRPAMLRLAICRQHRDGLNRGMVLEGLVLSLRTSNRLPFAAHFVMVRVEDKNEGLLAEFANLATRARAFSRFIDGHQAFFIHA